MLSTRVHELSLLQPKDKPNPTLRVPRKKKSTMEEAGDPMLLLDLPGTVFDVLWSSLPAQDRLRLFRTCRSLRDRALGCATAVALNGGGPSSLPLLRKLASRAQPLAKLSFSWTKVLWNKSRMSSGAARSITAFLQEAAAAHTGAAGRHAPPWPAAASLRKLKLKVGSVDWHMHSGLLTA